MLPMFGNIEKYFCDINHSYNFSYLKQQKNMYFVIYSISFIGDNAYFIEAFTNIDIILRGIIESFSIRISK